MSTRLQPHPHPWRAFAVVGVAIFLTVLDLFIVNVALPTVAAEFPDASTAQLSWVLTLYAIVFAAALVPAGKLGDIYGRRKLFLVGLVIFLLGSLLASVAVSVSILLVARAVQAIGAAAATPNALAVLLPIFPAEKRPVIIALWGALAGLGAAAGPPLGGLLAQVDWRLIFLINLPVGLIGLAMATKLVPEIRDEKATRFPDAIGGVLLAAAIAALVLGLSQAPSWGWDVRVWLSFVVAVVLTAAVALRSRRHPAPVVEPELVRSRSFRLAMAATVFFWAAFAALLLASAMFLSNVWGYSVLATGFGMTPGPAISVVFAALSRRLSERVGPGRTGMIGSLMLTGAAAWLALVLGQTPNYAAEFLPTQLLAGAGIGIVVPTLVAITVSELPLTRLSTGIAVYSVFRQIGVAVGAAAWVATLGATLRLATTYQPGWWAMAGLGVATAITLAMVRFRKPEPAAAPVESQEAPAAPQEEAVVRAE